MEKQTFRTIQVEINQGNRATIAEARTVVDGHGITATAEALRHPNDKNDPELGIQIATARAVAALVNKLARRASGRVKMNDDNSGRASKQDGTCRAKTQTGERCKRSPVEQGLCPTHKEAFHG